MKNIIAVAIDECHLIWDWETFRPLYAELGRLKNLMRYIPFVCVSATLTQNVASYVHEVVKLRRPTVRYNLPVRRDNINLVVSTHDNDGIQPLLALIPPNIKKVSEIPKVLVFHDNVDNGIDIAKEMIRHLPATLEGLEPGQLVASETVVQPFYASLDPPKKRKTLAELKQGDCRIVICTDAFGLGINIPDIDIVIQWCVDEKITISTLYQRVGRAARRPSHEGIGVVYVQKSLLNSISKNFTSELTEWETVWKAGRDGTDLADIEESEDVRVIPTCRDRDWKLFGLPVGVETEGYVRSHQAELYKTAVSLREAHRAAKHAARGTRSLPLPLWKKIDPSLLWFICVQGCRHMVLGKVFVDQDIYNRTHKYWCCDWCALRNGNNTTAQTAGLPAAMSILNAEYVPSWKKERDNDRNIATPPQPTRQVSLPQMERFHDKLQAWRFAIWQSLQIPNATPDIVLSNKVLNDLKKTMKRLYSPGDIARQLQKSGLELSHSLLRRYNIEEIYLLLEEVLSAPVPQGTIQPRPVQRRVGAAETPAARESDTAHETVTRNGSGRARESTGTRFMQLMANEALTDVTKTINNSMSAPEKPGNKGKRKRKAKLTPGNRMGAEAELMTKEALPHVSNSAHNPSAGQVRPQSLGQRKREMKLTPANSTRRETNGNDDQGDGPQVMVREGKRTVIRPRRFQD